MISKPLIAVVEDEDHLAQGLLYNLKAEGYRTHHEADGDSALAWLLKNEDPPAAVILDVMLPGRDGFSIVRALRDAGHYTPVLLLTARGRSEDVVEGFAAGADDYIVKPFSVPELLARVKGLLRRASPERLATIRNRALLYRGPHHRLRSAGVAHAGEDDPSNADGG